MKRNYRLFSFANAFLLATLSFTTPIMATDTSQSTQATQAVNEVTSADTSTDNAVNLLPEPSIVAEAGILMEGTSGQILYEKNPHETLSPASITKLMTALLAIESLSPEDTLTFSDEALTSISSDTSRIGMREGETITVNDALHGLLLMSANDVANGLAEKTSGSIDSFVYKMNQRAVELGALNTNFANPHGLYDPNHYTSVYDMALITKEVIKSDYFLSIMQDSLYQIPATNKVNEIRYLSQQHKMLNTKKDLRIYRDDVIAGKVGYTTESGHTLVTVAKRGSMILIAVIMKTDADHLYSDTAQMLDYGFANYTPVTIDASDYIHSVPIKDSVSEKGTATLTLQEPVTILLPVGQNKSSVTFTGNLPESLTTDIAVGQSKGTLTLSYNTLTIGTYPLVVSDISSQDGTDTKQADTSAEKQTSTQKGKFPFGLLFFFLFLLVAAIGIFYKYMDLKAKRLRLQQKRAYYEKIKKTYR